MMEERSAHFDSVSHVDEEAPASPPRSSREAPESAFATQPSSSPVRVTLEPVEMERQRRRDIGAVARSVADEELQRWNYGGRSDPAYISNRPNYHPATRVVVDVEAQQRRKPSSRVQRVGEGAKVQAKLRNYGYWPLRLCFEDTARGEPDPGGSTVIRIALNTAGSVVSARVLRSDLKHRAIAECEASALRRLKLDAALSRAWVGNVKVAVWPGDTPLVPVATSDDPLDAAAISVVYRAVETIGDEVSDCLGAARTADAKLWGRLALSFAVAEAGRPVGVTQFRTNFGSDAAVQCVSRLLGSLVIDLPASDRRRFVAAWRLHPAVEPSNEEPNQSNPGAPGERP
jgi:hypothetical protein